MAPLAIPLIIAGTGLMAAGQIQEGRAAAAEGKSAQNISDYNVSVMEQEAKAAKAKSVFDQTRQVQVGERIKSTMLAKMGASGGDPNEGTNLLLQSEQASELELENLMIGYEGELSASRARSQGTLYNLQGKLAKQKGKNLQKASYLKAGGTLLTGFGAAGSMGDTNYNPLSAPKGSASFAASGARDWLSTGVY